MCAAATRILCFVLSLVGGPCAALPVVFSFGGTLYDVAPQVALSEAALAPGDRFSGFFVVDPDGPRAADGSYDTGVVFDLTVAGWHFSRTVAGGAGGLSITNGAQDWLIMSSTPTDSPVFGNPYVGPMQLVHFGIALGDASGAAITDIANNQLPRNADFDLSKFGWNEFGLHFSVGNLEPGYTRGHLEYFSSSLPEPGTAALVSLAILVMAMRAGRRVGPLGWRKR